MGGAHVSTVSLFVGVLVFLDHVNSFFSNVTVAGEIFWYLVCLAITRAFFLFWFWVLDFFLIIIIIGFQLFCKKKYIYIYKKNIGVQRVYG